MLSQTAEYALRAVVHVAGERPDLCTTAEIAAATEIPRHYLSKVMQSLVNADLVRSQRGLYGGFLLNKADRDLTVYEVVQAVDPIRRIQECPLGREAHRGNLCPLHRRLDAAVETLERGFRETTIAEILAESPDKQPLCDAV